VVWDYESMGGIRMEEMPVAAVGGVALVVGGAAGAIAVAVASSVFSITSARQLRVELRAFNIMTGFRSLVLLFADRLELEGRVPPADCPSCFRFQNRVLPGSLSVLV
jgi:hypothetical protein